jgi:hypothetical protein
MIRRAGPLLVLLLFAGCVDDSTGPDGPALRTVTTESWDYLDNRFFRLDLPHLDTPGRAAGERIDFDTVRIYRFVGDGAPQVNDVADIAVAIDTTGRWNDDGFIDNLPLTAWAAGQLWRPLGFTLVLDEDDAPVAVDLGQEMAPTDLLGVAYTVVDGAGVVAYRVGDRPGEDPRGLVDDGVLSYRLKLLKPAAPDPITFQYVLRNVYWLGAEGIQLCDFDLVIERNTTEANPGVEHNGLSYLRIFGLDRHGRDGQPRPDGRVDKDDSRLFDLTRGLLRFPLDFPHPFAATAADYAANAGVSPEDFAWDRTFLAQSLTPEIYRSTTLPALYPNYAEFRLIATVGSG